MGNVYIAFGEVVKPLLALSFIYYLLQIAGLKSLMSAKGAVGVASAAAGGATGGLAGAKRGLERAQKHMNPSAAEKLSRRERSFRKYFGDTIRKREHQARKVAAPLLDASRKSRRKRRDAAVDRAEKKGKAKPTWKRQIPSETGAQSMERGAKLRELQREAVFGKRDESGQVVKAGVMQRATSAIGLVNMATENARMRRERTGKDVDHGQLNRAQRLALWMKPAAAANESAAHEQRMDRREEKAALREGYTTHQEFLAARADDRMATMRRAASHQAEELYHSLHGEDAEWNDSMQHDPEIQRELAKQFAERAGVSKSQVIGGEGMPYAVAPVPGQVLPKTETLNDAAGQAALPYHYLSDELKGWVLEADGAEQSLRLNHILRETGYMNSKGEVTNMLDLAGIDPNSATGQQQIQLARSGKPSQLDALRIDADASTLSRCESLVEMQRLAWADEQTGRHAAREEAASSAIASMLAAGETAASEATSAVLDLKSRLRDLPSQSADEFQKAATEFADRVSAVHKEAATARATAAMYNESIPTGERLAAAKKIDIEFKDSASKLQQEAESLARALVTADPQKDEALIRDLSSRMQKLLVHADRHTYSALADSKREWDGAMHRAKAAQEDLQRGRQRYTESRDSGDLVLQSFAAGVRQRGTQFPSLKL